MNKLLLIFLLTFSICSAQQTVFDSIFHDNIYRQYVSYIPQIYNPSVSTPLLFNFHGRGGNPFTAINNADFRDIADTANFIIVHPKGLLNSSGESHWNYGNTTVDDIGFINSLYNKLIIDYNIDLSRVYSVGMSNGGAMSYFLACDMNDKIAAIASVTGAMTSYQLSSCNPIHSTPILQIHGTNDTVVNFSSMQYGLEYWRSYNNCNLIADTILIPNYDLSDSSTVEHVIYGNGDNGVTTELFKIINGGHSWPGSNFNFGGTNFDINASEEVWKFLSKYDINGLINQSTYINEIPEDKKIIMLFDALGRDIKFKDNSLIFYLYDDGSVEKKIILNNFY